MKNILDSIVIPKKYRGRTLRPTINIRRIGAIGAETVEVYPGNYLSGTIYFDYNFPVAQKVYFSAFAIKDSSSCWAAAANVVTLSGSGSDRITTKSTEVYEDVAGWYDAYVMADDADGNHLDELTFSDRINLLLPAGATITNIKDWIVG